MKHFNRSMIAMVLAVALLASFCVPAFATELKTGIGIVDASALRLRSEASTDSDIVSTALYGDSVVIIKEVGDWYLVNYNLDVGYMYKEYVTFKDKENVKIGYARFEALTNVRQGPGTDTGIVDQAPKGETCFIIGFNTGWYKVYYNGQLGYVRSDLVEMLEKPYANAGSLGNTYHEDAKSTSTKTSSSKTNSSSKPSSSSSSSSSHSSSSSSSHSSSSSSSHSSSSSSSSSQSRTSASSSQGEKIAAFAMQYLGYRYTYAGSSPSSGFDCSGLTWYVARQFGYTIGRTADQQLSAGTYVSRSNLKPGDIVLFERTYVSSERATHAGIYIGNGQFIHAANSRTGVVISSLSMDYYSSRFICGRRLG